MAIQQCVQTSFLPLACQSFPVLVLFFISVTDRTRDGLEWEVMRALVTLVYVSITDNPWDSAPGTPMDKENRGGGNLWVLALTDPTLRTQPELSCGQVQRLF